jgi:hypothetical protein
MLRLQLIIFIQRAELTLEFDNYEPEALYARVGWTRSGTTGGNRASFHITFCVTDGGIPNTGLVLEVSGMGVSTQPCDEGAIDEIRGFIGRREGGSDGDGEG